MSKENADRPSQSIEAIVDEILMAAESVDGSDFSFTNDGDGHFDYMGRTAESTKALRREIADILRKHLKSI